MDEKKILRMNLLGGMNSYIRDYINEDAQEEWLTYGVPDEADEETIAEIADDDEQFVEIAHLFGKLIWEHAEDQLKHLITFPSQRADC